MFGGGLFVSLPWRGVGCSAMYGRMIRSVFLLWSYLWVFAFSVYSRDRIGETLSGPDSHDTGQDHMVTFSVTGVENGRSCCSGVFGSISSTSLILSGTSRASKKHNSSARTVSRTGSSIRRAVRITAVYADRNSGCSLRAANGPKGSYRSACRRDIFDQKAGE
jgi:hypothetical protein